MSFALQPKTEAGERFITAAQTLVPTLRKRSAQADRSGQVCVSNYQDLQSCGIAAAFVPEELGGFGLVSIQDWITGIATIARGDGSTAIAINMHLGVTRGMALAYRAAQAKGRDVDGLVAPLLAVAAGKMLICATATERGTDNLHPMTEANRTDDGWRIDGNKLFVTMSPIATHIGMNLRMRDGEDSHLGTTLMPMDTPGIHPQNDWDALGMRASGSQSITFDNVCVPAAAVRRLGPWGQWSTGVLINRTFGNLPLVAAFMGIAEHARELALASVQRQKRLGEPIKTKSGVQHLVGEMEIELSQCRSILQQAAQNMDVFVARYASTTPPIEAAHEIMKDYQSAKWVVNRGAINIVSHAMDLLGGAGFMNEHILGQLYRDVRAGPFMQPYAPTEAKEYVGRVTLGLFPEA